MIGRMQVNDLKVDVVCAHLTPELAGAPRRAKQVAAVVNASDADALVLLGDLNVRAAEVMGLCEAHGFRPAQYAGKSWDPNVNRFYDNALDGTDGRLRVRGMF